MKARNRDGTLSEAAFQAQVEGLARFYGWRIYHAPDNKPRGATGGRDGRQRVTAGFPDLVLLRPPELIFAELKAERGVIAPAQAKWIAELEEVARAVSFAAATAEANAAGYSRELGPAVDVYVWRPSDFDEVNARLSRGRHRQPVTPLE